MIDKVRIDRRWLPLNALRAFEGVARYGSFTSAASALSIAQSALSRHVISLENLIGLLSLVLFTMHGALYLAMKTDGDLRNRLARWISTSWIAMIVLYVVATVATLFQSPFLFAGMPAKPLFWGLLLLLLGSALMIPVSTRAARFGRAFLASSVTITCMIGLSALSLFPRLVPSSTDLRYSLTAYNASSTGTTLSAMLVIALIGMPLVIAYTIFIYRVFEGKVVITSDSY
jgi:cytochrome d ubiquinol oxidase subunit II